MIHALRAEPFIDRAFAAQVLGRISALDSDGQLWVRLDACPDTAVRAHLAAPHGRQEVLTAIAENRRAVIAQLEGQQTCIVMGFVVPQSALAEGSTAPAIERREDRLVLKAGPATITLHNDGKVDIRGARVVTRADGDHRIMGRTVRIN